MTDLPEGFDFPTENPDLESEVYNTKISDLVRKLEATIHEAGYQPQEVLPALSNLLVTRFTEAENPDRLYRIFIKILTDEYDELMDRIEAGEFDD
jgi:hypothetical protein